MNRARARTCSCTRGTVPTIYFRFLIEGHDIDSSLFVNLSSGPCLYSLRIWLCVKVSNKNMRQFGVAHEI